MVASVESTGVRSPCIMALLHVVDPATEVLGDKLSKVESFVNYFKTRRRKLYQPQQNVAKDERMVKSRHRQLMCYTFLTESVGPAKEWQGVC